MLLPIIVQDQSEVRKQYLKGFLLIGGILGLLIVSGIIIAATSSNVTFDVVDEGRFIHLDYEPKQVLDQKWQLEIWTEIKTEGIGEFKEEFYPFIKSWKLFIQDHNDNEYIAWLDYNSTGEGLIHPEEVLEFFYTFESSEFVKDIYLMKFRSEVLIGNTTYRESLDFHIELEGVATGIEVLMILGPTFSAGLLLLVNFRIQKRMNKVFWEDVRFYNAWLYLLLYLFTFRWLNLKRKEKRRNRRLERNLTRQNQQVNRRTKRSTPKETAVQENKREVLFYAQENLSKEKPEVEEECVEGKNSLKLFSKMIHFK